MMTYLLHFAILSFASTGLATKPPITDVVFAPGGASVVACSQSGVHLYSWPELQRQKTFKVSASNLHCLAFSPTGIQLAVGGGNPSEEGGVEIFSWPAPRRVSTFRGHDDSVRSVVWRNASKLLTASFDRQIKLWDVETEQNALFTYNGHSRSVAALCLLNAGKILVSAGNDRSVRVWDLESGELVRSLNQHTAPIHSAAVRPSEGGLPMVATAAADRTIRFWQPTIGRMVRYVRLDAEPLNIAWLGDGSRILAACVDGHVRVVDPEEVKILANLPAIDGWAYAIAVHPSDGTAVVGGGNGQLRRVLTSVALP